MSRALAKLTPADEQQLIGVLQTSLYPGAKVDSIKMVIDYCQTAGLDPMQKPVHIVPMNTKDAQSGKYSWRDVIMPGIGLYRIQADRAGNYAGMSDPDYGPMITKNFTDKNGKQVSVTFPEYCSIGVSKQLKNGEIVEYRATEYWEENYATDSSKSDCPNTMWRKRPRGQIAKCAEAQALRKGWPELGSAPVAEEMEGKVIDMGDAQVVVNEPAEEPQSRTQTAKKKAQARRKAQQAEKEPVTVDAQPETLPETEGPAWTMESLLGAIQDAEDAGSLDTLADEARDIKMGPNNRKRVDAALAEAMARISGEGGE